MDRGDLPYLGILRGFVENGRPTHTRMCQHISVILPMICILPSHFNIPQKIQSQWQEKLVIMTKEWVFVWAALDFSPSSAFLFLTPVCSCPMTWNWPILDSFTHYFQALPQLTVYFKDQILLIIGFYNFAFSNFFLLLFTFTSRLFISSSSEYSVLHLWSLAVGTLCACCS